MAHNTKRIKRDGDENPIPQVYNPAIDDYEALKGDSGAARHVLYGPDGSPVDTTGNKLGVRDDEVAQALAALLTQLDTAGLKKIIDALPAGNNKIGKVDVEASALPAGAATEAKQDSTISELQNLQGKDFATQATLAAILAKMLAAPATEAKQDSTISELQNLQGKDFATQATLAAILAKMLAAPATEAKQDALVGLIGEKQASPTANTLLARIKALETKLDGIISGTTPAAVQLTGSNMEHYGVDISDRPDADKVPKGATFTIVDDTLDQNWVSDGMNWRDV